MRGQSVILFVSVVAIVLAAGLANDAAFFGPRGRKPAAVHAHSHKEAVLQTRRGLALIHTSKLRAPLETSVELVGNVLPEKPGDVFALRGQIVLGEDASGLEYEWSLPSGVEVVSGAVKGLVDVAADQPVSVEIVLRTLTGENHRVHMVTRAGKNGVSFGDSAQFNTLLQPLIEASKQELLRSTEEHAARDGQQLKVFH